MEPAAIVREPALVLVVHGSMADMFEPEAPDDHGQPVGDRGIIAVHDQAAASRLRCRLPQEAICIHT